MSEAQMSSLLEELYQKYYRTVYNHCLIMIRYQKRFADLIDDCVQEAFITFILSYSKLAKHPNHVGWLCNAAWNRMRSVIRRVRKDDKKLKILVNSMKNDTNQIEWAFEQLHSKEESLFYLDKIYRTLTDIERTVFDDYFLNNLSLNETAKKSDISRNSVRSAVDRIRKRARKG